MRFRVYTVPVVCLTVLFCLLRLVPECGTAQRSRATPAELVRLIEHATERINEKQAAALTPLTTGDPRRIIPWLAETTTPKWESSLLTLPAEAIENQKSKIENPPRYLAVFHAWHTCESDGDHVHRIENNGSGWRLGEEIPETDTGGFRVRHHDLRIRLEPKHQSAQISDRVRIERVQEIPTPNAQHLTPNLGLLRLSQDFRVQTVRRDGPDGVAVAFQQAGGIIAFAPPEEKTFTLYMTYSGVVNHRGSDYIMSDEATLNSYWYPHTARLPATATVTVTVPAHWTPFVTGEKQPEIPAGGPTRTMTFKNEIPICYYTLTAGRYVVTTRTLRGKTLGVYLRNSHPQIAGRSMDLLERAMTFFEAKFGPFPYSTYSVVETKGAFGGALEAYSFATFGPFTLPGTVVHELAHTWWGGLVPCTYTRSMWNESFANYCEDLFQRSTSASGAAQRLSADARLRALQRNASAYNAFSLTRAYDTSDGRQSAAGYGKGALVMRVLEEEIGQPMLIRSMREFLASHKRGEAAEWSDFEEAVNKTTGKDYRWFFAQWAERTGLPALRLVNVMVNSAGDGFVVEADILQSGTPYRLKVPLLLETQSDDPIQATMTVTGERTHIRLRVPSRPTQLTLDPEGALPLAAPPNTPEDGDPTVFTFSETDFPF